MALTYTIAMHTVTGVRLIYLLSPWLRLPASPSRTTWNSSLLVTSAFSTVSISSAVFSTLVALPRAWNSPAPAAAAAQFEVLQTATMSSGYVVSPSLAMRCSLLILVVRRTW